MSVQSRNMIRGRLRHIQPPASKPNARAAQLMRDAQRIRPPTPTRRHIRTGEGAAHRRGPMIPMATTREAEIGLIPTQPPTRATHKTVAQTGATVQLMAVRAVRDTRPTTPPLGRPDAIMADRSEELGTRRPVKTSSRPPRRRLLRPPITTGSRPGRIGVAMGRSGNRQPLGRVTFSV